MKHRNCSIFIRVVVHIYFDTERSFKFHKVLEDLYDSRRIPEGD